MAFIEIDIKDLHFNPFTSIGKEWMLITAGNEEKINTMRSLGTDSQVIILSRKSFDLYVRTSLEAKWSFSWHIIKNNI